MIKSLILGAGREVGKSCVVVTLGGKTIMFDCGMHMGYDDERRFPDFSLIPKAQDYTQAIDCVIITHFHLDHVGALPYFTEVCGYEGPVFMTFPTKALSPLMLEDYRKVMTERRGQQEQFTVLQIHECMKKVTAVDLRQTVFVGADIQLRAYYAGHVLGAAMFYVKVGDSSVVYTGDYNMTPDRHLGAAQIDRLEPDLIITESTYATTIRESKNTREREFLQAVHACVGAGGKVLIPVFALGRAQELCILLDDYWERMDLKVPIYMGAGLTLQANVYYKLLISWTNQKVKDTCATRNTFDFKHVSILDRSRIDAPGPCVLFATPGMITGGLSLEVFRRWAPFEQNMVVLPGYCIPGTVGYKLQPGKRVKVDKRTQLDVLCQVHHLTSSAHTDAKGIMDLIRHVKPRHVILVHGEKPKMALLKSKIESELQLPCYNPANGEVVNVPSHLNVKVLATERFLTGSRVFEDARTMSTKSDTEHKAIILEHVPSVRDYVRSGIVSMNKQGTIQVVDPAEAFSVLQIPEHRLVFKCYCPVYMKPHEDAASPENRASAFRENKNMQVSDEPSSKKHRKDLQETPILDHIKCYTLVKDGRRDMQVESACPTDASWSCASTDETKNTEFGGAQENDGASQKDQNKSCSDVGTETKEPQCAPTMAICPDPDLVYDGTESQKNLPSLSSGSHILHAVYMFLVRSLGTGILEEQADCIIGRSVCLRICGKDLENCEVEIKDSPDALLMCSWTSEDETLANRVLSLITTQFSVVSA